MVTIAHISDPHVGSPYFVPNLMNRVIKELNELAPEEEVKAYLAEPGTEQKFEQLIEDLKKLNPDAPSEISEAQKQNVRQQWATAQVIARKAVAAGADKDPKTQLQVRLQQARLLASFVRDMIGISVEPRVGDPGTLERSAGKARRAVVVGACGAAEQVV